MNINIRIVIPSVRIVAVPIPLTLISSVGIAPSLLPLTVLAVLAIPTISIAIWLLPLTILAIPAVGTGKRLLPLVRLIIQAVSLGIPLGGGESLTIHLGAKARGWGWVQT